MIAEEKVVVAAVVVVVDGKVRLGLACAAVVVVAVVEARVAVVPGPVPATGKDSGGIHTGPSSWLVSLDRVCGMVSGNRAIEQVQGKVKKKSPWNKVATRGNK